MPLGIYLLFLNNGLIALAILLASHVFFVLAVHLAVYPFSLAISSASNNFS